MGAKMVEIRMLANAMGSECGKITKEFLSGEIYHVIERLADVFVKEMRVAEFVVSHALHKEKQNHANKAITPAQYENKSVDKSKQPKGGKING